MFLCSYWSLINSIWHCGLDTCPHMHHWSGIQCPYNCWQYVYEFKQIHSLKYLQYLYSFTFSVSTLHCAIKLSQWQTRTNHFPLLPWVKKELLSALEAVTPTIVDVSKFPHCNVSDLIRRCVEDYEHYVQCQWQQRGAAACFRSHGPRYLCGSFNCIVHLHPAPLQLHTQLTWATLLTSLLFPGRRTPLTASSPRHRGPHRDCRGLRHLIQVGFEKRSSCYNKYCCMFFF